MSKKTLTPEQYAAQGGVLCPFCGSEDIAGDEVEIAAGVAHQGVGCNDCDEEWVDTYKLTGYEQH